MTTGDDRRATLVWIDSREAIIVRWLGDREKVERLESDVPVHRRTSGTGDARQVDVEGQRLEHLARFVDQVAARLPDDEDLVIIGPGPVREHLLNQVEEGDAHHNAARRVACRPARRMTEPQLVALLRHEIGSEPPRKPIRRRRAVTRRPTRHTEESEFSALLSEEEI